jgi:hypothetical protein
MRHCELNHKFPCVVVVHGRYNDILDAMEAAGLEPNASLHHFTHPQVMSAG